MVQSGSDKTLACVSAQEALRAWCEITPRAIFPGWRIGKIEDGYEASFMVLASDPLTDFTVVKV
jgi:predicted amidohydrolase YtcJ